MKVLRTILRPQILVAALAGMAVLVKPGADAAAQPAWAEKICACSGCLVVQTDRSLVGGALEEEAASLVDTLAIRLGRQGVMVMAEVRDGEKQRIARPRGEAAALCRDSSDPRQWFVVHLQDLSENKILVALDYLGSPVEDDMVREVEKGPDPAATAWTVALMLEDALAPYLDVFKDSPAIGAGLAIIEPPVVGGADRPDTQAGEASEDPRDGMRLSGISLGAAASYLTASSDAVFGPRLSVRVDLGSRFRAVIGGGWLGLGRVEKKNIDITTSYVPIEVLFGAAFSPLEAAQIVLFGGMSAGLTTYDLVGDVSDSKMIVFAPWLLARVEVIFEIRGPLWMGAHIAGAFPLIRDELQNHGSNVYRQGWGMPLAGIDLVYRLD